VHRRWWAGLDNILLAPHSGSNFSDHIMVQPSLIVASSKDAVPTHLNSAICRACADAMKARGIFTIALSGGSLPSFLSTINEAFVAAATDPKYDCWHVILADERCVFRTDPDSNLGAIDENFLSKVPIPSDHVYGINESKLDESTESVANEYETTVKQVLSLSGGQLDLAVLGFGPDGHTCSLFPGHRLLNEKEKMVAPIEDSPKPPPKRITLTFPLLNTMTRNVIFCGAGGSKSAILQKVFTTVSSEDKSYEVSDGKRYRATLAIPPPYPCAMVNPASERNRNTLTWIVDTAAVEGVTISE
jgi:6-phosphogluconolactonase